MDLVPQIVEVCWHSILRKIIILPGICKTVEILFLSNILSFIVLETRGGVEDTKLEAKAQKNLRPRTALQRTDPLEAKDRNARSQGPRT